VKSEGKARVEPIAAPKGVSEYFPPNSFAFESVIATLAKEARLAGYAPIELPIFEETELFQRGVGESTDVVQKEMYTFEDRGGRSITLRPEGTAGVMRSVIENNLDKGQLPVKLYYKGPFFRAERPQKGRYRQFYQFGIEAIGYQDPEIDFEVIALADRGYKALGLKNYRLELTSLGDIDSRTAHRKELLAFIAKLDLDEETKKRVQLNPLRLFDDKREEIKAAMTQAPLLRDYLNQKSAKHFEQVTKLLSHSKIDYLINPRMVRGLDYYTQTTFEFVHPQLGAQSGIGGGGRYDGLMAQLGGADHSGIGFGLGIDRIILALQEEGLSFSDNNRLQLFVVAIPNADATYNRNKELAALLLNTLRSSGIAADLAYGERALKGSMKAADKSGARFSIVIGDDEIETGVFSLKNMDSGEVKPVRISFSENRVEITDLLDSFK
jgi:histidyl-tRNA synthetase